MPVRVECGRRNVICREFIRCERCGLAVKRIAVPVGVSLRVADNNGVYFSVPGVATVRWDPRNAIVFVEWHGWANTPEFTQLLDAEINALQDHGSTRLLADCRRQRILNLDVQERANRDWLPRAIAVGLRRFAIILPENDIAAGHLREHLAGVPQTAIEICYFDTVTEACDWLARAENDASGVHDGIVRNL